LRWRCRDLCGMPPQCATDRCKLAYTEMMMYYLPSSTG
jgi:hypothetical protein